MEKYRTDICADEIPTANTIVTQASDFIAREGGSVLYVDHILVHPKQRAFRARVENGDLVRHGSTIAGDDAAAWDKAYREGVKIFSDNVSS